MAKKKARPKRKPTLVVETPITIGGGGGSIKASLPLTIQYNENLWTQTPGLLTLTGGTAKKIRILAGDDVDIRLPLTGEISLILKCSK